MQKLNVSGLVHNYMEEAVDQVLIRILAEDSKICACPTCLNDMASIALNKVPPYYVPNYRAPQGFRLKDVDSSRHFDMIAAVYEAVQKVSTNPRHNRTSPLPFRETKRNAYNVHNYAEDLVDRLISEAKSDHPDFCGCDQCVAEMATICLNDLAAKYTSTDRGSTYVRLDELDNRYYCQLTVLVHRTLKQVAQGSDHPPA